MKAIKIILLTLLLQIPFELLSTTTIDMSVGEKRTISLSNPPYYLKGCIWTTTHPDDVIFDPHPGSYSTSVLLHLIAVLFIVNINIQNQTQRLEDIHISVAASKIGMCMSKPMIQPVFKSLHLQVVCLWVKESS